MKKVITLTTDFGLADHYVGLMKGVILDINPEPTIVDITHEIPQYDITKAAFMIRNFYKYFPADSIHVVVVDPGVGSARKPIVVKSEHGIFVGPDNGVFSFVLDQDTNVYEITNKELIVEQVSNTFHGRDLFAPIAAHLSLGVEIAEVGQKLLSPTMLDIPQPKVIDNEVFGEVVYEDSFGNLITNIPDELIVGAAKIRIDGNIIDTVAKSYNEVKVGNILAIIGSLGLLEISVNQGSAAEVIEDKQVTVIL